MTAEQHKLLYNLGMRLSCDNSRGIHLCPGRKNYECFVYCTKIFEESGYKFGNAIGKNRIQIRRQTGEEIFSLEEPVTICTRYTAEERVEMVLRSACQQADCDKLIKDLDSLLAQSIMDVAIEKTLVLKESECGRHLPLIDFYGAFDDRVLFTHFRSLFQCLLQAAISDEKETEVIRRMTKLLQNWELIYDEREELLNQIESYMNGIMSGIEEVGSYSKDLRYLSGVIKKNLSEKKTAESLLPFLLQDEAEQRRFRECVTILAAFLKAYLREEAEDLLRYLQKYEEHELKIEGVKKLGKIKLHSLKAKKANADLIWDYLRDQIRYSSGEMFECIV